LEPGSKPVGRGYAVLAMLFAFQTLNFFDKLVFGLSAVPIMAELKISPRIIGLIGSSFYLLFPISGTLVGLFVIGRVRSKTILGALVLIWSASQIAAPLTSSVAILLLCRLILGLGEGPGLPTALHICYDWFPAGRRNLPSAIILQGISAGFLIGGPLLSYFIVHYGWRSGFLACGALGIIWLLVWSIIGAEGPHAAAPLHVTGGPQVPARALWLDPSIVGVMIMSLMSYYVVGMTATWLPPYLELGLGYRPIATGWIISAVFAFQSPLLLVGAWASQWLQRHGWSVRAAAAQGCTCALGIAGAALIAATSRHGAFQLALIAVGFAAPTLTTVFGPVILGSAAPAAERGKLIVVIYSANTASAFTSTYATGWIVDAAGPDRAGGFATAIIVAGLVLVVGAIASWLLIDPERTAARLARASGREV